MKNYTLSAREFGAAFRAFAEPFLCRQPDKCNKPREEHLFMDRMEAGVHVGAPVVLSRYPSLLHGCLLISTQLRSQDTISNGLNESTPRTSTANSQPT